MSTRLENKLLDVPDESRWFEKGRVDIVHLGGVTFARSTLEPGWRWSTCVGAAAGEDWCQERHVGYVAQGRMMVEMEDGTQGELIAGDAGVIPPGHDAWVVGGQEVIFLEFTPGPLPKEDVRWT